MSESFDDPTGEKAKTVKRRYQGTCRGCGAPKRVRDAMRAWQHRYGRLPTSYDWSRTHARRRGTHALERLDAGDWPPASVVGDVSGTWKAARATARTDT